MLQMAESGNWDHSENVQGSQDRGWRSNISLFLSSESHAEFGVKYLCTYMKHDCVGETVRQTSD